MKMTTDIPPQITTPDSPETRLGTLKFFDGFPDDATVEKVYDHLDFSRGVQAFLNGMPGASAYAFRKGLHSPGADNQTVLIMETLMDSKSLFLTANSETAYSMMWLDLKDGPLVIETPPTGDDISPSTRSIVGDLSRGVPADSSCSVQNAPKTKYLHCGAGTGRPVARDLLKRPTW